MTLSSAGGAPWEAVLGKTILLVDDDPMLCQLFETALVKRGYRVESAYSGLDALKRFNASPADLIVLDVMMAGMSGLEVVATIRLASSVPVVLLSARTDAASRMRGLNAGANAYLAKPITPDDLLKCIEALLEA